MRTEKNAKYNDPLLQLQQVWQQHKERISALPFLNDEELDELYKRSREKQPEPMPDTVVDALDRADRYARDRRIRYVSVLLAALVLVCGTTVLTQSSIPSMQLADASVSRQYVMTNVVNLLVENNSTLVV